MVNPLALVCAVLWIQDPAPPPAETPDPGPRLIARFLWAQPVIRTDSREHDAGISSGNLNLQDDADLPDRAPILGLELEWPRWRFSLFVLHLEGDRTLEDPFIFEEQQFDAGTRLHAEFEGGWLEAVYRADVGLTHGDSAGAQLLLGVTWAKYRFEFEGGDKTAGEGHPALWPAPAVGGEGRLRLLDSLDLKARVLVTRVTYVNPFHEDGGDDPKIVFDSLRAEIGVHWEATRGLALGLGIYQFSSYLRDSSAEDRHRVWFDATSISFDLGVSF